MDAIDAIVDLKPKLSQSISQSTQTKSQTTSEVPLFKGDLGGSGTKRKPINRRILDLEKHLVLLYKKLEKLQGSMETVSDIEKIRLLQKIHDTVRVPLLRVEQEYSKLVVLEVINRENIPEEIASNIIAGIFGEIQMINPETDDMRLILQQILLELQHPAVPAAKKLKVTIPLIAKFVALEPEYDTESLTRLLFPTFQIITSQLNKSLHSSNHHKPIN